MVKYKNVWWLYQMFVFIIIYKYLKAAITFFYFVNARYAFTFFGWKDGRYITGTIFILRLLFS